MRIENNKSHNFRKLEIWKRAMELVEKVYFHTAQLPDSEKFGLKSQINRCAVSIPSNIAEGSGRKTDKEFIRFLRFSMSSSYEIETQLLLIQNLFDINTEELISEFKNLQNMIGGFIRSIE